MKHTEVLIIGAGLTGLSAAVRLDQAGVQLLILEREQCIGGQIQTIERDGFTFETGPNTGTLSTPEAAELFDLLGEDLHPEIANASAQRRFIYKDGKMNALPSSLVGGLGTPLFTCADKLRLLGEPWRKRGTDPDESIASLAMRRLGRSFVDYAVDPFIGGIYAGDTNKLCTRYALPKLYALEADYGSFIRGAIAKMRSKKRARERKATHEVFSISGGLSTVIHRMADNVGEERICCSVSIEGVEPLADGGFAVSYTQPDGHIRMVHTHHIISTVGAYALPRLFPFLSEDITAAIGSLVYAPVVEVAVGYRRRPTTLAPAFGCLIPPRENRRLLGVLFPSDCFSRRAPQGGLLCAVFVGGMRHPELTELSDQELRSLVMEELDDLLGISRTVEPDLWHISRHNKAIPQYYADSTARLAAIHQAEHQYPGLHLAGGMRDGISIAHRITQGLKIADEIVRQGKLSPFIQ